MALAAKAITAGITNDLGSGSNVDIVVITKDGRDGPIRSFKKPVARMEHQLHYQFPSGTTGTVFIEK